MKLTNILRCSSGSALIVATVTITGCASTPPVPLELRPEGHSAGGVQVQTVKLAKSGKGLQVSGSVGRLVGYGGSSYRHLDVEIVAVDGAVLAREATNISPNPIRHSPRVRSHSNYAVTFPELPPLGSIVRVTVHPTLMSGCQN
ncbi:MAG: hypothetical protein QM813_10975 [Verrucomicrobiota bacterium]